MEKINKTETDSDKLLMLSIQTTHFKKLLETHRLTSNKIDRPLAQSICELLDLISNFTESAVAIDASEKENERERDINSIFKPAIDNTVLLHRTALFCNVCKHDVNKTSALKLTHHFMTDKHIKNMQLFANGLDGVPNAQQSKNQSVASDEEGSTQSLDERETDNHRAEKQQKPSPKQRLNSLPARIKDVIPRGKLPKKMSHFLMSTNLEAYTNQLLFVGHSVSEQRKHHRVCDNLRQKLRGKYPNIKTHPFGSFGIGLGDDKSDLDIFVDIDNCFYTKLPKRKMKEAIFQIQRILSNAPRDWGDFSPVSKYHEFFLNASSSLIMISFQQPKQERQFFESFAAPKKLTVISASPTD
jgi:predicted nucleotidyltransferase